MRLPWWGLATTHTLLRSWVLWELELGLSLQALVVGRSHLLIGRPGRGHKPRHCSQHILHPSRPRPRRHGNSRGGPAGARLSFLPRSPPLQGRVGWAEPGLPQPPPLQPPPWEDQSRAAHESRERGTVGRPSPSRTKGEGGALWLGRRRRVGEGVLSRGEQRERGGDQFKPCGSGPWPSAFAPVVRGLGRSE